MFVTNKSLIFRYLRTDYVIAAMAAYLVFMLLTRWMFGSPYC